MSIFLLIKYVSFKCFLTILSFHVFWVLCLSCNCLKYKIEALPVYSVLDRNSSCIHIRFLVNYHQLILDCIFKLFYSYPDGSVSYSMYKTHCINFLPLSDFSLMNLTSDPDFNKSQQISTILLSIGFK